MDDYEKKYKEVLEQVKTLKECSMNMELKESDYERIRKEIINYLKFLDYCKKSMLTINEFEKQGKTKSQRMISAEAKEALLN